MAPRLLLCCFAAALASVSLALAHSRASGAAPPPSNGKIAFASDRDGDYELYAMNPDGTVATRLTFSNGWDCCPSWSPDGTRIAFVS